MSNPSQYALLLARKHTLPAAPQSNRDRLAQDVQAAILATARDAFNVLETERLHLGDTEPTSAQELLDYLEGKPGGRRLLFSFDPFLPRNDLRDGSYRAASPA